MFEGFLQKRIDVGEGMYIHALQGGQGTPLLLLHGYPQTHAIWHKIAPQLAKHFTVVVSDLRGYGDSSKPVGDIALYSKRLMALDQVRLMNALGFGKFFVVGHDRGARVAHRLAADYPQIVQKLVVLDIAPTLIMYERTTEAFAKAYWHWFFLIQPAPMPETMIAADPEGYLRARMSRGETGLTPFTTTAWAEYVRCFDTNTIHASCQDYRAAASIDLEHDRADRQANHKLEMPVLALWGKYGTIEKCFTPLETWREVANHVQGQALLCGHYLPEEAPEALLQNLLEFL